MNHFLLNHPIDSFAPRIINVVEYDATATQTTHFCSKMEQEIFQIRGMLRNGSARSGRRSAAVRMCGVLQQCQSLQIRTAFEDGFEEIGIER